MKQFLLLAACAVLSLAESKSLAAIIWWDPNGTTSVGGNGTWDTTTANWSVPTSNLAGNQNASGSLIVWNPADAAGFCAGPSSSSSQGSFMIAVNSAIGFAGVFNGSGTPGPCTVNFSGSGSLNLAAGAQGFSTLNASLGSTTFNVPITGTGQMVLESSGKTFLNATNSYSGGTAFGYAPTSVAWTGAVNFNNSYAFGTGPITMTTVGGGGVMAVESNLTLVITNTFIAANANLNILASIGGLTFSGPWTLSATPNIGASNLVIISGKMSGVGGFTKYYPGTVVLSAANTYTGVTTISNGILSITSDNNLGAAPATPTFDLTLSGGTLNASNTLVLNARREMLLTANSTLAAAPGQTLTYGGPISGSFGLSKSNSGTLILTGTNVYTGATTIANGILEADAIGGSSTGTNVVNLLPAGTLSGLGFVAGPVTGSGTIAPGTTIEPGTLTLGNGLNLNGGGTFVWNLFSNSATTGYSAISLSDGNLTLGGSSKLSINFGGSATPPSATNAFWQSQQAWTIVPLSGSAANPSGAAFTTVSNGNFSAGTFTNYADGLGNIVLLYLPSFSVFDALYAAGRGFFGGENLILTNFSGLTLQVWTSTNASLSVSNWISAGQMSEQSLAPALPGQSRYSINISPTVSPTYVIAGNTVNGPYAVSPAPVTILTTPDFSTYTVTATNVAIDSTGLLALETAPPVILPGVIYSGGTFQFQFNAPIGQAYSIQGSANFTLWTNLFSGVTSNSPVTFTDPSATNTSTEFYRVVFQ